jgi:hypothetical protein
MVTHGINAAYFVTFAVNTAEKKQGKLLHGQRLVCSTANTGFQIFIMSR